MQRISFFLARKIVWGDSYQKSISTMTIVCFVAIFVASCALALTTAIMNGFEVTIYTKMQGIHSSIIIDTRDINVDMGIIDSVFAQEFPEISAFSPMALRHILLRTDKSESDKDDDINTIASVAIIKGINPEQEQYTSTIAKKIIQTPIHQYNGENFADLFNNDGIIIGKQYAQTHAIVPGDSVDIIYMRDEKIHGKKITFDTKKAYISGIFETGIDEYDNAVIYSSLSFLEQLYPNVSIDHINIAMNLGYNEQVVIKKLHDRLGLPVYSWKDLYPSLVASLQLEKYVSFFIIALILLVASINIMSLLFVHITQKRSDIAILKALGMQDSTIRTIFFIVGMGISFSASFCGLCTAVLISWILQHYPFITLPDAYYVTHLPVAMDSTIICSVFFLVIVFTIIATWVPLQRIGTITISRVLRFEG